MARDDDRTEKALPPTAGARRKKTLLIASGLTIAVYLAFAYSVLGSVEPDAPFYTPSIYDPYRLTGLFVLVLVVGLGLDTTLSMAIVYSAFVGIFALVFLLGLWLARLILDAPRHRAEALAREAAKRRR